MPGRYLRTYEMRTPTGDLVIAYPITAGHYRVTTTLSDGDLTQIVGEAQYNDADFHGRRWEYSRTGQQYPTLKSIMQDSILEAKQEAKNAQIRAFYLSQIAQGATV